MRLPLVFILTMQESFTPTRSGAIATHTHACCGQARAAGVETLVLARPHEQSEAYDDVQSLLFEAPREPAGSTALLVRRAERRVRQWSRLRFGEYVDRTLAVLKQRKLTQATLVVHNDPELVVALRKRMPKALLIHWFHNQHDCKPRPRRLFAAAVDHSIAVSDFIRAWAQPRYGLAEAAIDRVYNGVDLQLFQPGGEQNPGDAPVVNFTGRTGVEKAPDVLLQATLELTRRGVNRFAVQIIGANHWGERTMDNYQLRLDRLAQQIQEQGVNVRMTGHLGREQTARQMQRADLHVVPSRWQEPFGLTTVEGMACGLATVGSRTGATPEILGDDGLLFDNEDVTGLAVHLEALIGDRSLREQYAKRARQRAGAFSWARTWQGLQAVLEKAA